MKWILLILTFPQLCSAYFQTDLSLIYKKKVNQGPVLTQEYHKSLNMQANVTSSVRTRLGVICSIKVRFDESFNSYGPSDQLKIDVQIKNIKLNKEIFIKKDILVKLNSEKNFNFTSKRGDELSLRLFPQVI